MQRKLIIQIARFGDIIQTRRLIESLIHENIVSGLEKNEICLCVDKAQENLAKMLYPHIEIIAIHAFNASEFQVISENRKIFDYIKAKNFDEVYTLNYTALSYALIKLFDEDKVRGYRYYNNQEGRSAWDELAFKYMITREHSPLHITDYWAFLSDSPIEPHKVNPSAYEKMLYWQEGKGNFEVGIVLSGQEARRSVPPKDLALIIHVLASRFDKVKFKLLGTAKEEGLAQDFFANLPSKTANLVENKIGKTNVVDLLKIIKDSDLVISPDTGSLHAAAFYGVPSLSFFCSSAYCYETGAYGLGHLCVQSSFSCAPCTESKNCMHTDLYCHKLFSSPALFAKLAKQKTQKKMEDFGLLESSFDEIGLDYSLVDGEEKQRDKSKLLRNILYEYRYGKAFLQQSKETEEIAGKLFEGPFTFFLKAKV